MAVLFLKFGFPSLFLTWFLLFPLEKYLYHLRVFDVPNERSSHTRRTIRGGGLVLVAVIISGLIFELFYRFTLQLSITPFIVGAIIIAVISLMDDLGSLTVRVRLSTHILAAVIIIAGDGYWHTVNIPGIADFDLGWVGIPITILWIVGLANAYNFMDGIDGIAGGQAVVAGFGWALWGWLEGQPQVSLLGALVAGSSLGFLGHNWAPARIFMGDVGSVFLGYTFAALPLIAKDKDLTLNSQLPLLAVLFLWPFIFDSGFTLFRRWLKGEDVFTSHRSHLYQRLVIAGYSHQAVTLIYVSFALLTGLLAIAWFQGIAGSGILIIFLIPLLSLLLWVLVIRQEVEHSNKALNSKLQIQ
jgi:UDP-N-acetylmuramyl pentapeptide phosphotransferase/UDP-N-acetylglucosamine-1-phosphate transferase